MANSTETTEEVRIPVEEEFKRAAEKVKFDMSKFKTKMHRYPAMLRSHVNNDRYFVPSAVAIGPYHRGAPRLREAEEVKRAAVYYYCSMLGHSVETVYKKILLVADDARRCYPDDVVGNLSEAEFAAMMLHDVCFLHQYIWWCVGKSVSSLEAWFTSNEISILVDIFLLENQIPWLVFKALKDDLKIVDNMKIVDNGTVRTFIAHVTQDNNPTFILEGSFTGPHLLDALRCYMSGILGGEEKLQLREGVESSSATSSAIELREIGIKLAKSTTTELKDMCIKKGPLFGKLFLAPFFMDDVRASWLINMAALEVCMAKPTNANCTVVSGYVGVLGMLMNREEDMHQLRAKGIVHGEFSDKETLEFFNRLVKHLFVGPHYDNLLAELDAYKKDRWMWIAVHKFICNHFKAIVTVFSIIGVLVGIFQTLHSLKQPQQ